MKRRDAMLIAKAAALWLAMLALAVTNGLVRERLLIPMLGAVPGLVVSGIALSALFIGLSVATVGWLGRFDAKVYWMIGVAWVVATVLFEFVFGRLAADKSWHELARAYTFEGGNLWPLVLVVVACAPRIAARVRGLA